jgi:hypothetical protein
MLMHNSTYVIWCIYQSNVQAQKLRTACLGPTTYTIPDPWKESTKLVCGSQTQSSMFKSETKRFQDPKTYDSGSSSSNTPKFAASSVNQPSDASDCWNSVVFDKVGINGSIEHFPQQSSRAVSPDILVTSLSLSSATFQDTQYPLLPTKSQGALSLKQRCVSADVVRRSRKPGFSFTDRTPSPPPNRGREFGKKSEGVAATTAAPSPSANLSSAASYHETILARWKAPTCYSKKPVHSQMLQQVELQKLRTLQRPEEMGSPRSRQSSHLLFISNKAAAAAAAVAAASELLPAKPHTSSALPRRVTPDGVGGASSLRPHTTGGEGARP